MIPVSFLGLILGNFGHVCYLIALSRQLATFSVETNYLRTCLLENDNRQSSREMTSPNLVGGRMVCPLAPVLFDWSGPLAASSSYSELTF